MESTMTAEPLKKRKNERTCAGCNKHADREELVRVILGPDGEIAVDLAHTEFGHGGHVHPSPDCVAKAAKSGFSRVFKTKVTGDASAIGQGIVKAADRRIEGLLTGARRAGQLAIGSDVVTEALREGKTELVIVATDAAAAAKLPEVEKAVASGRAIAWNTKERLGQLMSRDEVAVIAVLHSGVAKATQEAYRTSGSFRGITERSEEAWSSSRVVTPSEVR
jgi:predicted RNA-binding protein YlxR (DUF448 family)/ribosomal protein L30E